MTVADFNDQDTWPAGYHDGCGYLPVRVADGLFCTRCGWGWSAWPTRAEALQTEIRNLTAEKADLLHLRDELQAQLISLRARCALLQSSVEEHQQLRAISDAELRHNRRWPIRRFLT